MSKININEICFKYGKPIYNPIIQKIFDEIKSNDKKINLKEICYKIKLQCKTSCFRSHKNKVVDCTCLTLLLAIYYSEKNILSKELIDFIEKYNFGSYNKIKSLKDIFMYLENST
jgi:hypothetical protein